MSTKPQSTRGRGARRVLVVLGVVFGVACWGLWLNQRRPVAAPATTPATAPQAAPDPVSAPARVDAEVMRDALAIREGRLHLVATGEVFTGTLVERYSPTAVRARIEIRAGLADGLSEGWYDTGEPEVREYFVEGFSHGTRTRWHKNGNLRSESEIVRGRLEGRFREWHENGRLAAEATLAADRPVGPIRRWSETGQPLPDYVPGPPTAAVLEK